MNLSFTYEAAPKGSKFSPVVEEANARRRDEATRRLAVIANGKDPAYINGKALPKVKFKRLESN
jgi:hypothetical protein